MVGDWNQRALLPPYEMFFLGGPTTVRGYPPNSLGPVDYRGVVTGGRIMALANLQMNFMLGRNWWSAFFVDGGMLSDRPFGRQSTGEIHASPGLGIRYSLPFGTARADFAAPTELAGHIRHWRWMLAWGEVF
jgi:outer membrane translocation and assembly module TamA